MKTIVSESHNGITVKMIVEFSPASAPQPLLAPLLGSQIEESQDGLLGAAMDRVHNQLLPLLRRARLLTEASLVEVVSCEMRATMPNAKLSHEEGGKEQL